MKYYISDPHFGDGNIMRFFNRPFKTADEMDAHMIAKFNEVVKADDELIILGDFSSGDRAEDLGYLKETFDALNGRKTLIKGNHDTDKIASLDWGHVCELLEIKDRGIDLVLCHYPMMTWNNAREDALHLFGHVHTNWKGSNAAINMAVELWDYQPADIQQIYNTSHKLPVHEPWRLAEPGMI